MSSKKAKQEAKQNAQNLLHYIADPINNRTGDNDMIPIDSLVPYANHPFKLYGNDRLSDMVRSIKEMGILLPIIVRPIADSDKYEILSGHNRVNAAKEAGLIEVPAIIKSNLNDDEAKLIVTETNLVQRSFADLSHSERAVAIKSHMDAIKSQGKRNDLIDEINELLNADKIMDNSTCCPVGNKSEKSNEIVGKEHGLSSRNVARYMRIAELIVPLLERVDNDEIAIRTAVSISYLSPNEQADLNQLIDGNEYKIDMKKAESLRELSEENKLTPQVIEDILSGVAIKKKNRASLPVQSLKIGGKVLSKYFKPEQKPEEIQAEIIEALEYFRARGNKS